MSVETVRLIAVWLWTLAPVIPLLVAGRILRRDLRTKEDSLMEQLPAADVALAEAKIRNDLISIAKLLIMLVLGLTTVFAPMSAWRSLFTLGGLVTVNVLIGLMVVLNDRDYRRIRSLVTSDIHAQTVYAHTLMVDRVISDDNKPKLEGKE